MRWRFKPEGLQLAVENDVDDDGEDGEDGEDGKDGKDEKRRR